MEVRQNTQVPPLTPILPESDVTNEKDEHACCSGSTQQAVHETQGGVNLDNHPGTP